MLFSGNLRNFSSNLSYFENDPKSPTTSKQIQKINQKSLKKNEIRKKEEKKKKKNPENTAHCTINGLFTN